MRAMITFLFLLAPVSATGGSWDQHHPDVVNLREGFADFEAGRYGSALERLTEAAKYGEKAAQALIAEMHWTGLGIPQDRAVAYAWADLAAERGYKMLLVIRERYWSELTDAERKRALDVGVELYEAFGDDVAKPRLNRLLREGARAGTGSRIRTMGNPDVYEVTGRNILGIGLEGHQVPNYYHPVAWTPHLYWREQDIRWEQAEDLRGIVDVLPVQPVEPQ